MITRHKPIQRRTPLKRTRVRIVGRFKYRPGTRTQYVQPIRSRSEKRMNDERKYAKAKAEHFLEHPRCQYPGMHCICSLERGDAMDLHHAGGRNGPLLYCRKYMRTACRTHHELAKSMPRHSRKIGWLIDVSSAEVRALRTAEL